MDKAVRNRGLVKESELSEEEEYERAMEIKTLPGGFKEHRMPRGDMDSVYIFKDAMLVIPALVESGESIPPEEYKV